MTEAFQHGFPGAETRLSPLERDTLVQLLRCELTQRTGVQDKFQDLPSEVSKQLVKCGKEEDFPHDAGSCDR